MMQKCHDCGPVQDDVGRLGTEESVWLHFFLLHLQQRDIHLCLRSADRTMYLPITARESFAMIGDFLNNPGVHMTASGMTPNAEITGGCKPSGAAPGSATDGQERN